MVWRKNIQLVAYADLGGKPAFKLAMQEVGGHFFLYVGSLWHSGWSILDVTDPYQPHYLRFVDGPPATWTIQIQVADQKMITGSEHIPGGWQSGQSSASPLDGFMVWDVSEPDQPELLGHWASGATGTHRNFYNGGRYVHACTTMPGYEGYGYAIVDIDDPTQPVVRGSWWYPGQHVAAGEKYSELDERRLHLAKPFPTAEEPQHSLSLHGAAYVLGDRAYCSWMRAGLVILDVSDFTEPEFVSCLPVHPPLGSTIAVHSAVPLPGRDLVAINSEALRESCDEPVGFAGLVDVQDERDPVLISLFPQPRVPPGYPTPTFCAKGGRFGPHNQHQHQGLDCLKLDTDHVIMTYFNAGLQVFDVTEPRDPYISAYYIPDDPTTRLGPLPKRLVHQAEDVIVDRRGYIYMSEKNSGIYVMALEGFTA